MSPSPHEYLRHMLDEIEWSKVTGIRDRLIHGYFGVDYRIVWDVATTKLPGLGEQLRQILATGDFLPL